MWHDDIVRAVALDHIAQLRSEARNDGAASLFRATLRAAPSSVLPSVEIVCRRAAARARSLA
jgi:hypothetical protein